MRFLYNISIYLYSVTIKIASLFNSKAGLWVAGRRNIFQNIKYQVSSIKYQDSEQQITNYELIWFHCASLGEFEQGRPLIEKLKAQDSRIKILLTFFSPSGYEIRKNYSGADCIFYLPIDTPSNAKEFIQLLNPSAAFFVKYEFWFNYLNELKNKNIPTYLVSGIFREEQHFFKVYGKWFRKQLSCFTHFYLQDNTSAELLKSVGCNNVTIVGDTRFDRVFEISKNAQSIDVAKKFAGNQKVMIAGSTWQEDEKILADWYLKNQESGHKNQEPRIKTKERTTNNEQPITNNYKLIIAPHEISEERIESLILKFSNFSIIRYSQADDKVLENAQILVIDNIGMLSSLYQYGNIAFIGGGFGKGIHNILEAATFGLPVLFGPNYQKFTEAKELIRLGGAFSVNNESEFEKTISLLNDEQVLRTASHISKHYVESRIGATDKILSSVSIK